MNDTVYPPLPLRAFRNPSVAMLRRYYDMSHELGRVPSILGREFFRTRVTTIHHAYFEDSVIFVHDVERCLELLEAKYREIIKRLIFQEYTQEEVAEMLHLTDRHVRRLLMDAIDTLSQLFIDRKLMVLPQKRRHMLSYDVLLEDPEDETSTESLAEALDTTDSPSATNISASAAVRPDGTGVVSTRNTYPWRELPVEISCQAPFTSQIGASL